MITSIELTEAGSSKLMGWIRGAIADGGRENVFFEDAMIVFADRLDSGESLTYEIGQLYTNNGLPQTITLSRADIAVIDEIADE